MKIETASRTVSSDHSSATSSSRPIAFTPVIIGNNDSPFAIGAERTLCTLLQPAIPFPHDKKMQRSFGHVIMKWMKTQTWKQQEPSVNLPYIHGFRFNDRTDLKKTWKIDITASRKNRNLLQLRIPSFIPVKSIIAPAGTISIECIITAASCTLQSSLPNGNIIHSFSVPYNDKNFPAHTAKLSLPMPVGSLIIVAVSLNFIVSENGKAIHKADIEYLPSGIVASMYV